MGSLSSRGETSAAVVLRSRDSAIGRWAYETRAAQQGRMAGIGPPAWKHHRSGPDYVGQPQPGDVVPLLSLGWFSCLRGVGLTCQSLWLTRPSIWQPTGYESGEACRRCRSHQACLTVILTPCSRGRNAYPILGFQTLHSYGGPLGLLWKLVKRFSSRSERSSLLQGVQPTSPRRLCLLADVGK
jgi:hypothetical protein